ncbi:MAG: hypothetical protein M1831_001604 [Alyxoria varia]|nr:MAG: hypothetical protein M1831_001604 [Alyxoria varia]
MNGAAVNGTANGTANGTTNGVSQSFSRPASLDPIPWATPHSPEFHEKLRIYSKDQHEAPSAIACPQTASDVSLIVEHCLQQNLSFTVRNGGHDISGRCFKDGVLCIDLRALTRVDIAADRKTARIGGGALGGNVAADLSAHGLFTPSPAIDSVGYVGWATMGGWGAFEDHFGFGVDQIVAATVVDSKGEIVEADRDMLRGIRGACGNFGVIVDITAKLYELEKIYAGAIIFDVSAAGVPDTFVKVASGIERLHDQGLLPSAAGAEPFIAAVPGVGPSVLVTFAWSSPDFTQGKQVLDRVLSLAPVAKNTVAEMTVPQMTATTTSRVPASQSGRSVAATVTSWSPAVLDVIRELAQEMPVDKGATMMVHSLNRESPSVQNSQNLAKESSFNPELRQPHHVIEILGTTPDESNRETVLRWAEKAYHALRKCDDAIVPCHPCLLDVEDRKPENVFGANLESVQKLKKSFDPDGVFKYAVPSIF